MSGFVLSLLGMCLVPKPSSLGKRPLQDNPKPVLGNQIPRDVPKTTLLGGFFMPLFYPSGWILTRVLPLVTVKIDLLAIMLEKLRFALLIDICLRRS